MSLQSWNQNQNTRGASYRPGKHEFTEEVNGTRYIVVATRILVKGDDGTDLQIGRNLEDAIQIEQPGGPGTFEIPEWDAESHKRVRDAVLILASTIPDSNRMFGMPDEVDSIRFLCGAASLWGGNKPEDAVYLSVTPERNDGRAAYSFTVRDVPVDGFWSVTVYGPDKYIPKNTRQVYSFNNLTAQADPDGAVRIRFANDEAGPNTIPIVPGWSYTVRLYRPRREILDGSWKFPTAEPVD